MNRQLPPQHSRPEAKGIELKHTTAIVCEKCQSQVFQSGVLLRKVSALVSGTGKPGIAPIDVLVCSNCKQICTELLPEELRSGLSLNSPIVQA